jgi:hypothetical protein
MAFKTVPKWILVILLTGNEENYYSPQLLVIKITCKWTDKPDLCINLYTGL